MKTLREHLIEQVERIEGVQNQPSPVVGGSALFYHSKEFAHFHSDNEIDLRLTRKIIKREKLVRLKESLFHPERSQNSQWIALRYDDIEDVMRIAGLVKQAVEQL